MKLVVLSGPTASGKSALALAIAREFPVEIVSADSLQVYRRFDIGTAKPTAAERAEVPHHMIDVADWFLGGHPLEAQGRFGLARAERQGDMADFFSVQYAYPNGVASDFIGTRFASGYRDQCVRVQGTRGTVDSHYMGAVNIVGANPWKGAETDATRLGAQTNVQNFLESIRAKRPIDNTASAAQSNLTAILGRTAAYRKQSTIWEEMMRTGEKLEARIQE